MVHEHIKVDMKLNDFLYKKVEKASTLTANVLTNMGILFNYTARLNYYRYMTSDGSYTITCLPRPDLFDRIEGK
jgi:hypothetical protein